MRAQQALSTVRTCARTVSCGTDVSFLMRAEQQFCTRLRRQDPRSIRTGCKDRHVRTFLRPRPVADSDGFQLCAEAGKNPFQQDRQVVPVLEQRVRLPQPLFAGLHRQQHALVCQDLPGTRVRDRNGSRIVAGIQAEDEITHRESLLQPCFWSNCRARR